MRSETSPPASRRLLGAVLRVIVSLSAFGYLLATVDGAAFAQAFGRMRPGAAFLALLLLFGVIGLGTLRWTLLLRAYGATRAPGLLRAFQLYLVGFFYNLYLPGAVTGDLLRAVASREAFGEDEARAATAGVTVVFVERVMGLSGLVALCALSSLAHPARIVGLEVAAALGLIAAITAVVAIALGRRFGARLPGRIGRIARRLPELESAPTLLVVFAICVAGHFLLALTGHTLMLAIEPSVRLVDSIVIFPIGSAAAFFPLTVGGAGVREATLVALFRTVGIGEASALAGSLALFGSQLFVAGLGGLWHIARPLSVECTRPFAAHAPSSYPEAK
ncbi:MAG: flippase-like domain-containing protein [Polyangiaceae bacterium]|nr:flippase-like domain-containing protein [Polyangiaceae bacterium]